MWVFFFFVFWRLFRASLALWSDETSIRRRAIWCIIAVMPFVSWSTASNIKVSKLFWGLEMRFLINCDNELAFRGFCGILEVQSSVKVSDGLGGVGVCNCISSFERTLYGSYSIR